MFPFMRLEDFPLSPEKWLEMPFAMAMKCRLRSALGDPIKSQVLHDYIDREPRIGSLAQSGFLGYLYASGAIDDAAKAGKPLVVNVVDGPCKWVRRPAGGEVWGAPVTSSYAREPERIRHVVNVERLCEWLLSVVEIDAEMIAKTAAATSAPPALAPGDALKSATADPKKQLLIGQNAEVVAKTMPSKKGRRKKAAGKPSYKDLAALAGVSVKTLSRWIHAKPEDQPENFPGIEDFEAYKKWALKYRHARELRIAESGERRARKSQRKPNETTGDDMRVVRQAKEKQDAIDAMLDAKQ